MVYGTPEEWRALIDEQAKGGKSAAVFCCKRSMKDILPLWSMGLEQ
ncbi:MAG: hypothetical protein HY080_17275 [Gammaproteobacteria bacterium]|nr:hypothetical protein [Gammaproteobacteria bacterium]